MSERARDLATRAGLGLLRAASGLPLPLLAALGRLIGRALYYLHAPRRRIVAVNIAKCFPELSPRARARLVRRHFSAFGQGLFDVALAWWASRARLERLVRLRNREYYDNALKQDRPVILLAPHFVALEIGGMRLAVERRMAGMYLETKNPAFNRALVALRTRFGGDLVERAQGLKPVVRALKRGSVFYYLPDQDLGRRRSVFAPFFGIQTATVPALARLAILTDAVVLPCVTRQRSFGRGYEVVFGPPLSRDDLAEPIACAARVNVVIERAVRESPEQYFWVHKRFKTRPPGEPGFYDDE